jgi:NAD(P)-dependent dehydrogenase (short-subunit alcohol dehydrogenase family)
VAGRLDGKVALVTGAASGIGRASALAFAREGARVVVSDIVEKGGHEVVDAIKNAGGEASFTRADVSKASDVEAMVNHAVETYGRLDYAFNNAGIEGELAPTAGASEAMWRRVIDINLTGVWLCMKYEIPQMLKQGGGAIVNMSSILGLVGFANAAAYTAAKHGVVGVTKAAALEYADKGIRINAVCPGFIRTPMVMERGVQAGADPEAQQGIASLHPMGRMGEPEEIAQAVIWLCSDEASFVTGYPLAIDGGYVVR